MCHLRVEGARAGGGCSRMDAALIAASIASCGADAPLSGASSRWAPADGPRPPGTRPPPPLSNARMLLALLTALSLGAAPVDLSTPPVVVLVPLGEVDGDTLQSIRDGIASHARVTVRIDAPRPLPKEAYYAPRKRWRAEKLLDALDAAPPEGAWKVVAVTAAEISTTKDEIKDWGIGGLGNIGGRSCVVSTHLVRKHSRDPKAYARRIADLAVHEFGHTLGLDHCPVPRCVMSDAQGKLIRSLDASTGEFCDLCRHRQQEGLLQLAAQPR